MVQVSSRSIGIAITLDITELQQQQFDMPHCTRLLTLRIKSSLNTLNSLNAPLIEFGSSTIDTPGSVCYVKHARKNGNI